MSNSNETNGANARRDGRATVVRDRRSVLRGIGIAGLSGALVGTAAARGGQSGANGASPASEDVPISAQFWSFNEAFDAGYSVADLVYEMADAGYDAFEPYFLDDEEAILEAIAETGVTMASAHQGHTAILDDPDEVADRYLQFGEPLLVEPWQGTVDWTDEEAVLDLAHDLNEAAELMAEHGLEVGYHNHDFEFQQLEGSDEIAFDVFARALEDVHLQIDVGWVLTGGANPIRYISKYKDKVSTIHMKNMVGGDFVEIDEGDVNMKAVANAARAAANVDYLIYEYDNAPEPLHSLEYGAAFLERWNGPRGRS